MLDYINEAFRSLQSLDEDIFSTDYEGINNLSTFMDEKNDTETVRIIDPEADSTDDINTAYVGKVIIDCNVCHSHIFKNKEDIVITDEGEVNIEEQCPYCGEQSGFIVVGEITKYPAAVDNNTDDAVEETATNTEGDSEPLDTKVEESYTSNNRSFLRRTSVISEAVNNVNVETDDSIVTVNTTEEGKVTVTTEPKQESSDIAEGEEVITPVSSETTEEIISSNDEVIEEPDDMTEINFDIDEVDEETIDELGESYLKRVYENVDSFKTSAVSSKNNRIIVEGVINFKSGVEKKTGFIFEAKAATKTGKVKFIGENKHLCRGNKAFTLTGKLEGTKLIAESFTYNYRAKTAEGKSAKVYGTVYTNHK